MSMTLTAEQLYREHYHEVVHYLISKTGRREEAEDLAQETFIRALHAFATLHPDPRPWLFTVAAHLVVDAGRRSAQAVCTSLDASLEAGYDPSGSTRDDPASLLDRDAIGSALRQLPERYRRPLILFACGYSISEIAHQEGCSRDAIKTRLARARALFRKRYSDVCA